MGPNLDCQISDPTPPTEYSQPIQSLQKVVGNPLDQSNGFLNRLLANQKVSRGIRRPRRAAYQISPMSDQGNKRVSDDMTSMMMRRKSSMLSRSDSNRTMRRRSSLVAPTSRLKSPRIREWKRDYRVAMKMVESTAKTGDLQGKRKEALVKLKSIAQLHKDKLSHKVLPVLHTNIGILLLEQNDFEPSIEHFHLALQFGPNFWKAHYNLGLALMTVDRLIEAQHEFKLALEHVPVVMTHDDHSRGSIVQALQAIHQRIAHDVTCVQSQVARYQQLAQDLVEGMHVLAYPPSSLVPMKDPVPPTHSRLLVYQQKGQARAWAGPVGCVVHRLHLCAALRETTLREFCLQRDVEQRGVLPLEDLNELLGTSWALLPKERAAILSLYAQDPEDALLLRYLELLSPSTLTLRMISQSQVPPFGATRAQFHAAARQRYSQHQAKKNSDFYHVQNMPLYHWIESIFNTTEDSRASRNNPSSSTTTTESSKTLALKYHQRFIQLGIFYLYQVIEDTETWKGAEQINWMHFIRHHLHIRVRKHQQLLLSALEKYGTQVWTCAASVIQTQVRKLLKSRAQAQARDRARRKHMSWRNEKARIIQRHVRALQRQEAGRQLRERLLKSQVNQIIQKRLLDAIEQDLVVDTQRRVDEARIVPIRTEHQAHIYASLVTLQRRCREKTLKP